MDVLIVDDHPIIHETLSAAVRAAVPGANVHAEASLASGLARARRLESLGLVLLDLGLPGCSGIEALTRFLRAHPGTRIAIVSATEDTATVQAAIDAGAAGYIPKTSAPGLMVAALKLVASGGTYLPPQIMRKASMARYPASGARTTVTAADLKLTERQADVLRLVMKGLGNREIARQLNLSENTVKQHAHAVFRTLGVASRTEAMVALARMGVELD